MWLKLMGSALVVAAGTCIGFTLAGRYAERPQQIRQLISCLTALKSYVGYVSMPLPEALVRSAHGVEGPVREFMEHTAETLKKSGWLSPREAMASALQKVGPRLVFHRPESELCLLLGSNLGFTNREEQQKYLTMVVDELQKIEQDSIKLRDQNVKMYRYLGICGGMMIAILLV